MSRFADRIRSAQHHISIRVQSAIKAARAYDRNARALERLGLVADQYDYEQAMQKLKDRNRNRVVRPHRTFSAPTELERRIYMIERRVKELKAGWRNEDDTAELAELQEQLIELEIRFALFIKLRNKRQRPDLGD